LGVTVPTSVTVTLSALSLSHSSVAVPFGRMCGSSVSISASGAGHTVTVTEQVALPPGPVTLSSYSCSPLPLGVTSRKSSGSTVPPGLSRALVASWLSHSSLDVPPGRMWGGVAEIVHLGGIRVTMK